MRMHTVHMAIHHHSFIFFGNGRCFLTVLHICHSIHTIQLKYKADTDHTKQKWTRKLRTKIRSCAGQQQ